MTPFIAFSVGAAVGLALGLIFRNKGYEKAIRAERALRTVAEDELTLFRNEAARVKAEADKALEKLHLKKKK